MKISVIRPLTAFNWIIFLLFSSFYIWALFLIEITAMHWPHQNAKMKNETRDEKKRKILNDFTLQFYLVWSIFRSSYVNAKKCNEIRKNQKIKTAAKDDHRSVNLTNIFVCDSNELAFVLFQFFFVFFFYLF